jgi:hypothetical protein
MFLSGLSAGVGAGGAVASGEMVPNKHRYFALGAVFVLLAPLSTIGPGLGNALSPTYFTASLTYFMA